MRLHAAYPSKRLVPKRMRLAFDWVVRAAQDGAARVDPGRVLREG